MIYITPYHKNRKITVSPNKTLPRAASQEQQDIHTVTHMSTRCHQCTLIRYNEIMLLRTRPSRAQLGREGITGYKDIEGGKIFSKVHSEQHGGDNMAVGNTCRVCGV
jgi:hypothetical protein